MTPLFEGGAESGISVMNVGYLERLRPYHNRTEPYQ